MTKKTEKKINKSAWILSQPAGMSAAEIVKAAKKEGIKLTPAYVYVARNNAKKAGGKFGRPRKDVTTNLSDMQRQFVALAVRIGTDDAKRLLELVGALSVEQKASPALKIEKAVSNGVSSAVGVA